MFQHLAHREADVFRNLAQKNRRNVATSVKRERRGAARAVSKLLVGTTLPNFNEAQPAQNRGDFGGLENRDVAHDSGDRDVLYPDKLGLEDGIPVFKKH